MCLFVCFLILFLNKRTCWAVGDNYTGFAWVLKNLEMLKFYIEKDYRSWKDVEICLTQAIEFSEFTL